MKIHSVRIENFRSFKDETIYLNDYTCFVGSNGAGKSTLQCALNVFFRQYKDSKTDLSNLSIDDFHHKDTSIPIQITVEFSDLSNEAQQELSTYVRQGKLIVTAKAEYNEVIQRAEVKQYGNRLVIENFRSWFDAEKSGEKVDTLKSIYKSIREKYVELPAASTKAAMQVSLNNFEEKHPEQCSLVASEDQFYGVSKGANKLANYIQWVYVPASKDIVEEGSESKNSALGQLLLRAVRGKVKFSEKIDCMKRKLMDEYQGMLEDEQEALTELSYSIEEKLKLWATPSASAQIVWKKDIERSIRVEEPMALIQIGENGFLSELSRFGHGMQRSYMLSLLQELATSNDETAPTLVMAIEEPELYQHPPQSRYLSELLQDLSINNNQILVCSHSPYFIPGDNFPNIRLVRMDGEPQRSKIKSVTYEKICALLESAGEKHILEKGMQAKIFPSLRPELSEMFFSRRLIFVEGIEDVAYITTYLHLMDKYSKFREAGYHIIPVHGKSELIKPIALAKLLEIPYYVICDADTDKTKEHEIEQAKKENKAILFLNGIVSDGWPENDIYEKNITIWKTNLTTTISSELGNEYKKHENRAAAHYSNAGGLKKNPLAISRALEYAWAEGVQSDSLKGLINRILE
ncbi:AAA ATPase domain-containing protein [Kosakonia radicincitans]|uniref:ATP-dependent nuclease n=1 Tax=Kosakonia radicincitans TaxID=283686 RepID=UPI0009A603C0|nr:ATP-dependent endonuclease [Kosakonia radicincitans]SKC18899.1 AAA ATPase domain-containing protein [Kosakonia radicincitans]